MQLIFSNQHACFTDDEIDEVSACGRTLVLAALSVTIHAEYQIIFVL